MPPRRSHRKSRAGCRRCKHRKIKCDEVHPRCGNCTKHGVSCDFESCRDLDDLATPGAISVASPAPTTPIAISLAVPRPSPSISSPTSVRATPSIVVQQPAVSPASASDESRPVSRLLELRLLHEYTTKTCKTLLTNQPVTHDIWQHVVPKLAFTQGKTFLADAMLSVAALHLRSQHPADKAIAHACHAYSASTLAAYISTLNAGVTADNAEALFLTASLIAFQATASRIFIKEDADASTGHGPAHYTLPMAWFHAFQGVKNVVAGSWAWIRTSTIVQAVVNSQPSFQLDLNPQNPGSFFGHLLEGLDEELATDSQDKITATHQAYLHAVSVLNWAHKSPDAPAALAFPASVSRRFVEVVEERRPRALAVLACFFALLKRMDQVWWLENVCRREVMGLVGLFESGSSWWRHLEWPVRIALWDGDAIPSDVWGVDCKREAETNKSSSSESMMSHIDLFTKQNSQQLPELAVPGQAELELIAAPLD